MDVYINGAASKPLKFKDWNLKMVAKFWKSPEILSSFFFRFLKLDFRSVWDRNLPPQKKSILLGTGQCDGCMINDISIFHSNSFMPSPKHKKREGVKLSNVKSSPFPSSCDSRQDVQPLQGLRVASRGIQNAIEQTWKWHIYGIWTNYFLWRMWSIFLFFCMFPCKR